MNILNLKNRVSFFLFHIENSADTTEKIAWLRTNVSPWETVSEYWDETLKERKNLFCSPSFSIRQYFNNFPCLAQQKGKDLVINLYNNNFFFFFELLRTFVISIFLV